MKLSKEIFNNLVDELSKTPTVNKSEWEKRISLVSDFKKIEENNSKITNTKLTHYSFRNKKRYKGCNKFTYSRSRTTSIYNSTYRQEFSTNFKHFT